MFMEKVKGISRELEFKLNSLPYAAQIVIAIIGLVFPYAIPATFLLARRINYAITSAAVIVVNLISTFFWESVPIIGIMFGALALIAGLMMFILWFMGIYYFITVIIPKKNYR